MELRQRLLEWVRMAYAGRGMPCVSQVVKPPRRHEERHSPFTAVALDNGAVGICYHLFGRDPELLERYYARETADLLERPALQVAHGFLSPDPIGRTLGFATLNALCQGLLLGDPKAYGVDYQRDVLDLVHPGASDTLGMVGYFFRYADRLLDRVGELVVVEKSARLLAGKYPFTMTADPSALASCNKVLITATTILNGTLAGLLAHCPHAEFVAVIGPSAGICPQPLFDLGVTVVGGTLITDPRLFLERFAAGEKWGDAKRKFIIVSARPIPPPLGGG